MSEIAVEIHPRVTTVEVGTPAARHESSLTLGTVTLGSNTTDVAAEIVGEAPERKLNLRLPPGAPGPANSLTIGTVTTRGVGTGATATITGTAPNQILNLGIPTGATGDAGPANTLTIGTVTDVPAGGQPSATITGTAPNQVLNLGIPRGDTGDPPNISMGTVTTLAPGSSVTATLTGTSPNYVLNLGIPKGDSGQNGTGTGDVVGPASVTTGRLATWANTTGDTLAETSFLASDVMLLSSNQFVAGVKTFEKAPVISTNSSPVAGYAHLGGIVLVNSNNAAVLAESSNIGYSALNVIPDWLFNTPVLSFAVPTAVEESDDGITWTAHASPVTAFRDAFVGGPGLTPGFTKRYSRITVTKGSSVYPYFFVAKGASNGGSYRMTIEMLNGSNAVAATIGPSNYAPAFDGATWAIKTSATYAGGQLGVRFVFDSNDWVSGRNFNINHIQAYTSSHLGGSVQNYFPFRWDADQQTITRGHVVPNANNTFDNGSAANRWRKTHTVDLDFSGTLTGTVPAANLSGTVADARLPARLHGDVNTVTADANTAIDNGWYNVSNTSTNIPIAWWGSILTVRRSTEIFQTYYRANWDEASALSGGSTFRRWRDGAGNWTAWTRVYQTAAELDTRYQASIAAGTTAQYYRGDKTWATLDKASVGLGNVANAAQVDLTSTQTVAGLKTFSTGITVPGANLTLTDTTDATKKVIFDISSIGAGITRTMQFPNAGGVVALIAATQTLSNKTISGANNTITNIATSSVTGLDTALAGKADLSGAAFTGNVSIAGNATLGDANTDVHKIRGAQLDISTLTVDYTYTGDKLTSRVEKDGAATVKSVTYNYTGDTLTSVVETAGGSTVTTTYEYTNGVLTRETRSVA